MREIGWMDYEGGRSFRPPSVEILLRMLADIASIAM
jgi:hypothetical protein